MSLTIKKIGRLYLVPLAAMATVVYLWLVYKKESPWWWVAAVILITFGNYAVYFREKSKYMPR